MVNELASVVSDKGAHTADIRRPMPPEDRIYRESVNSLMASGSSEIISNGLPQHAAVLLECFFRNATAEIKILCNRLRPDVYDAPDVLSSLLSAAHRGVSIQVLVRNAPEAKSLFATLFEDLAAASPNRLFLQTDAAEKSASVASRKENFAVMDRKAYRFEADSQRCEAVASMNSPFEATTLSQVFDRLYTSVYANAVLPGQP